MTLLTHLVLVYQMTGSLFDTLRKEILLFIYRYPLRRYGAKEDDQGEFLLYIQENITNLAAEFKYCNVSFEAYLTIVLRWKFYTYASKRLTGHARNRNSELAQSTEYDSLSEYYHTIDNVMVHDSGETIGRDIKSAFNVNQSGIIESKITNRHIIVLTLKACENLQPKHVEYIASLTGYRLKWLMNAIKKARESIKKKNAQIENLKKRRSRIFMTILSLQSDFERSNPITSKEEFRQITDQYHKRMCRISATINRISGGPTNEAIAQILNIPKGTVDSIVYYQRQQLRKYGGYATLDGVE